VLIATAGAGTFAVPLDHSGVNRLRFSLPSDTSQVYYMSYLHDRLLRSRVFEFSVTKAPIGKEDLDYAPVQAVRAPYLLPHLEYAIWETSETFVNAITDGTASRTQLSAHKSECAHLSRRAPQLASGLRRNLDELEMMAQPLGRMTSRRMPASVTH
jgi:hypothetical protein